MKWHVRVRRRTVDCGAEAGSPLAVLPHLAEQRLVGGRVGEGGPGEGAGQGTRGVEGAVAELAEDVQGRPWERRGVPSLLPLLRGRALRQKLAQEGQRGCGGAVGRPRVEDVEEDGGGCVVDAAGHEGGAQGGALVSSEGAPRGAAALLRDAEGEQVGGRRRHRGPIVRDQGLAVALRQRLDALGRRRSGRGGGRCRHRGAHSRRVAGRGPAKHAGQAAQVAVLCVPGDGVLGLLQHGPQHASGGNGVGKAGVTRATAAVQE